MYVILLISRNSNNWREMKQNKTKVYKAFDKFRLELKNEVDKLSQSDKALCDYIENAKITNKFDNGEFEKIFMIWQDQFHFLFPIIEFSIENGKLFQAGYDSHKKKIDELIKVGILSPIEPTKVELNENIN